jgi:hypothetical protein
MAECETKSMTLRSRLASPRRTALRAFHAVYSRSSALSQKLDDSMRSLRQQRWACAVSLCAAGSMNWAAASEPPEPPGLVCTVTSQQVTDGMRLEIEFKNDSEADLSIGPGPHLVWYVDAAAQESMVNTARASRVQNAAFAIPARSTRNALFAVVPAGVEQLRCNRQPPAAAALYVYQFSQRPRFRCVLRGYDLTAITLKAGCSP